MIRLFEDMKNAAANNDYIERNSCRLYTTNVDNHEFSLLYTTKDIEVESCEGSLFPQEISHITTKCHSIN